eukprot:1561730-Rhodomonas_salina.1
MDTMRRGYGRTCTSLPCFSGDPPAEPRLVISTVIGCVIEADGRPTWTMPCEMEEVVMLFATEVTSPRLPRTWKRQALQHVSTPWHP